MSSAPPSHDYYDAVIIGGGFFGCCLALSIVKHFPRILILEKESDLLTRASVINQARVHNGYHYPRSMVTALRSAFNYPRFGADFEDCVDRSFLQVYAIARGASRVTAYQYKKFCENVGLSLRPAPKPVARLFQQSLIEEVFCAEECAFDALRLRERLRSSLNQSGIEVACGIEAERVAPAAASTLRVEAANGIEFAAGRVFNCAYSQINHLLTRSSLPPLPLKHEIAEIALIRVPPALEQIGITVMDGPFFSTMPFPPLGLHSLSHVSYTPHESWTDLETNRRPALDSFPSKSVFMLKDAQRYVPALRDAEYVRSLFEIKTVLLQNEVDDGRPILCRRDYGFENFYVILGAKIDNIYDVLQAVDADAIPRSKHEFHCQDSLRARTA
jgi:glycine/D-amino acid oxidase-like deaminating enzyme